MLKGAYYPQFVCNLEVKRTNYDFSKYNMKFGNDSYCFRTIGDLSDIYSSASCYKSECIDDKRVKIYYKENNYMCESDFQLIEVNSNLTIICPNISIFCKTIKYSKKILNEPIRIKLPGDINNFIFFSTKNILIISFIIILIFIIFFIIKIYISKFNDHTTQSFNEIL